MDISVSIEIASSQETIWQAISDIDHCGDMISTILAVEVLHRPPSGLVGLKWKETRKMFGKEASETMWITEAVTHRYYCTRAESHGAVYVTQLSIEEQGDNNCRLTMSFKGEAQTWLMTLISFVINPFMKGTMEKMLLKDLTDIKTFVEGKTEVKG